MNVLSFDVESNGLHGDAFSVAGVLMAPGRQILSQFVGRCPIVGPVDSWVAENVLEPMKEIAETHQTAKAMRSDFWDWYIAAKAGTDFIVAANPYPVEARFLIACQEDDLPNRGDSHPFPYYDLSSMLFSLGAVTPEERRAFVAAALGDAAGEAHNPLWDATAAAITALKVAAKIISPISDSPEIIKTKPKASA